VLVPTDSRDKYTVSFDTSDQLTLERVIELGDRHRQTLGFLPRAGFRDAAVKGHIAVARGRDGEVAAYCLYDLPREVVRIVHVCVDDAHMRNGLAATLIEAVSQRHAERLGLRLKCRSDWDADKVWPRLGFSPRAQVPGRSKNHLPLTIWWRSHGHTDLFSGLMDSSPARRVAIDSNVFSDLHSAKVRQGSNLTGALATLVAADEIRLVLPHTANLELYRTQDAEDRKRLLQAVVNYEVLEERRPQARPIADELIAAVETAALIADPSLNGDATLIAEAAVNGVDVFVTRDQNVVTHLATPASRICGMTVVAPGEVATILDFEGNASSYFPVHLQETGFSVSRGVPTDWTFGAMSGLLNRAGGERKTDFQAHLHMYAMESTSGSLREVLRDGSGLLQAAWVTNTRGKTLGVPFLRVVDGRLQATLTRQLAFLLRRRSLDDGLSRIEISDPFLQGTVTDVLLSDGFLKHENRVEAHVLSVCGAWPDVLQAALQSGQSELNAIGIDPVPSPSQAAELERVWWPAKILGSGVPSYVVPIRSVFAVSLLGYPSSLLARDERLGLSREQVYYRSPRGQPVAPARILWYSSRDDKQLIGCSRLIESTVGSPTAQHRRFAQLGVWSEPEVAKAARKGQVGLLRFGDTQLFARPLSLSRIRDLTQDGPWLALRSPQSIDDLTFARLYQEGVQP
jgi:hypothetical protein